MINEWRGSLTREPPNSASTEASGPFGDHYLS